MKMSLRTKLIISFLIAITICGFVAAIISVWLIDTGVIQQAQDKVKNDLNSARLIYKQEIDKTADVIRFIAIRYFVRDAILNNDLEQLEKELEERRIAENLDILTLTDKNGIVLVRSRNPSIKNDSQADNIIVSKVLSEKQTVAGTVIIPSQELQKESKDLAEQALIKEIKTPRSSHISQNNSNKPQMSSNGMAINAGAPIFDDKGNLIGVLYGGNRYYFSKRPAHFDKCFGR